MSLADLPGHVFVVPDDLTQLRADAVVYSTSTAMRAGGHLYAPFAGRFPWFARALQARAEPGCAVGHAFCLEPDGEGRPSSSSPAPSAARLPRRKP
jgi:hypothetical protein